MGIYLINFIVYSMAMVGLLFVCLMVYKKTMVNNKCAKNNNELTVENALNLSARKTLYVVNVSGEKFLIASDAERTTFLSKLNENTNQNTTVNIPNTFIKEESDQCTTNNPVDYTEVMSAIKMVKRKPPIMREILRKLDERAVSSRNNKD